MPRAPARSFETGAPSRHRQPADDEHQARRAERRRLVDGAAIVVERRARPAASRREHAATAVPRRARVPLASTRRAAVASRPIAWRSGRATARSRRMPCRAQPSMISANAHCAADGGGVEREQGGGQSAVIARALLRPRAPERRPSAVPSSDCQRAARRVARPWRPSRSVHRNGASSATWRMNISHCVLKPLSYGRRVRDVLPAGEEIDAWRLVGVPHRLGRVDARLGHAVGAGRRPPSRACRRPGR